MAKGKTMHFNTVDYKKEVNYIKNNYINMSEIFDTPMSVDGNKAIFKHSVPVKEIEFGTLSDDCATPVRPVECLEVTEWEMDIDQTFDHVYKVFECSLQKILDKSGYSELADWSTNVESKIIEKRITDAVAYITGILENLSADADIVAAEDIFDIFGILQEKLEELRYNPSDFNVLVSTKVKRLLTRAKIDCCTWTADSEGFVRSDFGFTLVHVPSYVLPTGVDIVVYYKNNFKLAIDCKRATWMDAVEKDLLGWTLFDRYEIFGYDYRPVVVRDATGNIGEEFPGYFISLA